jgi:hypothetical protein
MRAAAKALVSKETYHSEMAVRSVAREVGPKVGETIPPFSAVDQFGRRQTRETISGPSGAVIAFVRSADW